MGQSRHFNRRQTAAGLPRSTDNLRPPGMSGKGQNPDLSRPKVNLYKSIQVAVSDRPLYSCSAEMDSLMKRPKALEHSPLPGRTPEAEFLGQVGSWYIDSQEARQHKARIQKLRAKQLISVRRHRTTYGKVVEAYELTDAGLARLEQIAGQTAANHARIHRQYLRDQARKNRVEPCSLIGSR